MTISAIPDLAWNSLKLSGPISCERRTVITFPSSDEVHIMVTLEGTGYIHDLSDRQPEKRALLPDGVTVCPPGLARELCIEPVDGKHVHAIVALSYAMFGELALRAGVEGLGDGASLDCLARPMPAVAALIRSALAARSVGADEFFARTVAQCLAAHLITFAPSPTEQAPEGRKCLSRYEVEMIDSYMRAHLAEVISLDDLAGQVNLSRFYFSRLFRATTGSTPLRYLADLRMQVARRALESEQRSIAHIARVVGFTNAESFTRAFRRHVGCTPSQYREAQRTVRSCPV